MIKLIRPVFSSSKFVYLKKFPDGLEKFKNIKNRSGNVE